MRHLRNSIILTRGLFVSGLTKFYGTNSSGSIELAKQSDVDSLKSSVSSGKAQIASAITDKGVSTSSTASFSTMANNIKKIEVVTDGIDKLITGWDYNSAFRGHRNETPEVTGTCVYTASNSSNSYTLSPYQYNTTTAICSFRRSSSTYFRLNVPSSTFDGKKITLSGANRIESAISLSAENRYFKYYIEDYDPNTGTITVRVPSFSFTEDGVTKRITCTNLRVIATVSSEIYAMPPNDNVYFDDADFPISFS